MNLATDYRHHQGYNAYASEAAYFAGLGADPAPPEPSWLDTLIKAGVPALTSAYTQRELTKFNIARLNAGQSPITAEEFGASYQPASARVTVGPDPMARNLMIAALIGGAIFIGVQFFAPRRR